MLKIFNRSLRIIGLMVGIAALVGGLSFYIYTAYYLPPEDIKQLALEHEFRMQAKELDHRTHVCNEMVDNMTSSPEYLGTTAFQCAMMWKQLKLFEAFVTTMRIQDPEVKPLVEMAFRTAARYAEYQTAINRPNFKPSPQE